MDDDANTSSSRLENLGRRLDDTKKALESRDTGSSTQGSAYSFGFRLATDLIAGVLGGFGLGWALDYFLGTSPWFLLLLTPLGMAAGVLNVMRAAKSAEARRHLQQTKADGIPSVPDDED